jgi:acyl-CoA reductase-like NAD-dependent aldehyde dehydrogenase
MITSFVRRVSGALKIARRSATMLIERVPETMHATRAGAQGTTSALQTLPDTTLRWLAASSVGLGAGFYLARAPRLVIAAGVAPALIMGAAVVLRPIEPLVPAPAKR